jgi:hypothetical protein
MPGTPLSSSGSPLRRRQLHGPGDVGRWNVSGHVTPRTQLEQAFVQKIRAEHTTAVVELLDQTDIRPNSPGGTV